jgi:protocadherin-16/23
VVPVAGSPIDADLDIDQNTGEIRTKVTLDREVRSLYSLSAIPLTSDGENIRVSIEVGDVNDNRPTFPSSIIEIGLPENTARDSKRQLPPALDRDLGIFNTQRYDIVSGNTKNAFRLASARDREGVLRLDLQVNGFLDREAVDSYKLLIEAQDGGSPVLKGTMIVNVTILDLNDNPPSFLQQRYYATVPENVTVGASVIQVTAEDPDNGNNGEVTYAINRRQSDSKEVFAIDEYSGLLTVNKVLDFESKESHELVVVARDRGDVPQETTAFITVRITDINDNQPTIKLDFKTPGGRPEVWEDVPVGQRIADVVVADPDEPTKVSSLAVTLSGDAGHFKLERMNGGYHLVLAKQLDREVADTFNLLLEALDEGSPPLRASLRAEIKVTDVNDNKPQFGQDVYHASILEAVEPGSSVFKVTATDKDSGANGEITYRIENSAETHSDWFDIEPDTGLIVTRTEVDCETDPEPRLVVVASDRGNPRLSSSTSVRISIQDINDNEPIFERTFYNATLKESERVGLCFLKVAASDPDCGINSVVTYRIGEAANAGRRFRIQPGSGEICLASQLDHERESSYDLTVVATDKVIYVINGGTERGLYM